MKKIISLLTTLLLGGCVAVPPGVEVVDNFDLDRYLGTWYEIARLDHSFERGLSKVSATYTRRDDGGIDVLNRGYDAQKGEWKEAKGRAYPLGEGDAGSLKVSFFRPFYAGYHIMALDHADYRYALVCGPSKEYLWILARTPQLEATVLEQLLARATAAGFATNNLIFVAHAE